VDILTCAGQLELASEFRFDYWHTDNEHRFYTVSRGVRKYSTLWGVCEGGSTGAFWVPEEGWGYARGYDAYRFELEDALKIAKRLAFEENQKIIGVMEGKFPGEFRGGPYDQAATTAEWTDDSDDDTDTERETTPSD